ncbi:MAG: CAP domain-containing protein [Bacteroidales bacterium]|nr:CAP domain-containing protein [Bacteroidales bacterium]
MKLKLLTLLVLVALLIASTAHAQSFEEKVKACESKWPAELLKRANTAKDADYLNDISKQSIYFVNLARLDGPLFDKTFMSTFVSDWNTATNNEAYKTLKEKLKNTKGLMPLKPNPQFCKASQYHADDTKKNSHTSGDGTSATQRLVNKFGCISYTGECMAGATNYDNGLRPILQWLIDGGHGPKYGHRQIVLNPHACNVGVGFVKHDNALDEFVYDIGGPTDDDFKDFVYTYFPPQMIKAADVARNVNYMSDKEKDMIMYANLGRIDLEMFFHKVYTYFYPLSLKDTAFINGTKRMMGKQMALLFPDRNLHKTNHDAFKDLGFKPFGPVVTDGQTIDGNYRKSLHGNTTTFITYEKMYEVLFNPTYNSISIIYGYNPQKYDECRSLMRKPKSTDNFPNQNNIVTLEGIMGKGFDKFKDVTYSANGQETTPSNDNQPQQEEEQTPSYNDDSYSDDSDDSYSDDDNYSDDGYSDDDNDGYDYSDDSDNGYSDDDNDGYDYSDDSDNGYSDDDDDGYEYSDDSDNGYSDDDDDGYEYDDDDDDDSDWHRNHRHHHHYHHH